MNAILGDLEFKQSEPVGPRFRVQEHDRLTINGKQYNFVAQAGDGFHLQPSDGQGVTEKFTFGTLSRLSAMGAIKHEVAHYLPDHLKPTVGEKTAAFRVSDLTVEERRRFFGRYVQINAIDDLVNEGRIRPNKDEISKNLDEIEERMNAYLQSEALEHDMLRFALKENQLPPAIAKRLRKERGGYKKARKQNSAKSIVGKVCLLAADTLRKLYAKFKKYGLGALADSLSKSGNWSSPLRTDELVLLVKTVKESYLTPERKTLKATLADVRRVFKRENERLREIKRLKETKQREETEHREEDDVRLLRIPGRDAVRSTVRRFGKLRVIIARHGREHAIKMLRPVGKGIEFDAARPGQRVEMDEWLIDLLSIIYSAKCHKYFGTDFLEAVGLTEEAARWWLVLAIDCRTKVILGMKLTRNPSASAATECLRMVISDKGQMSELADAISCWSMAVKPELLVTDNGVGFKAEKFTSTCMDLGISVLRTHAGIPGMRGTGERIFGTAILDLMPRLSGRTFSSPKDRGSYDSKDRACLDAEDLAFVLVRWVVDIYHNSAHEGLLGRTPLEQWEEDMRNGNYPLSALPDAEAKRIAFGKHLSRTVSKEGIVVMGVRYHGTDLVMHDLGFGSKRVDVRWDPENIGAISVFLDGAWREVPAVHERFAGVHFHTWMKARKALRAKSASRKVWDEEVVFRAIDQIEELVQDRSIAFGLIDTTISDEQFKKIEQNFFSSFSFSGTPQIRDEGNGLGREITPRAPDPDPDTNRPKKVRKTPVATSSSGVETEVTGDEVSRPPSPADEVTKPTKQFRKFGLPCKQENN